MRLSNTLPPCIGRRGFSLLTPHPHLLHTQDTRCHPVCMPFGGLLPSAMTCRRRCNISPFCILGTLGVSWYLAVVVSILHRLRSHSCPREHCSLCFAYSRVSDRPTLNNLRYFVYVSRVSVVLELEQEPSVPGSPRVVDWGA